MFILKFKTVKPTAAEINQSPAEQEDLEPQQVFSFQPVSSRKPRSAVLRSPGQLPARRHGRARRQAPARPQTPSTPWVRVPLRAPRALLPGSFSQLCDLSLISGSAARRCVSLGHRGPLPGAGAAGGRARGRRPPEPRGRHWPRPLRPLPAPGPAATPAPRPLPCGPSGPPEELSAGSRRGREGLAQRPCWSQSPSAALPRRRRRLRGRGLPAPGCSLPVLVELGVLQPLLGVALVRLHQRLDLFHADFILGEYLMEDTDQLLQAPRLPGLRLHRLLHHRRSLPCRRQPLPRAGPRRLPLCAGRHGGSSPPPRRAGPRTAARPRPRERGHRPRRAGAAEGVCCRGSSHRPLLPLRQSPGEAGKVGLAGVWRSGIPAGKIGEVAIAAGRKASLSPCRGARPAAASVTHTLVWKNTSKSSTEKQNKTHSYFKHTEGCCWRLLTDSLPVDSAVSWKPVRSAGTFRAAVTISTQNDTQKQ